MRVPVCLMIFFWQAKKREMDLIVQAKEWLAMVEGFTSTMTTSSAPTSEEIEGQLELLNQAWSELSKLGVAVDSSGLYLRCKAILKKCQKDRMGSQPERQERRDEGQGWSFGLAELAPLADLKKFSGDFTAWAAFKEDFMVDVHLKPGFRDFEKLRRLKHCVAGGAADDLIRKFKVTVPGHYELAWQRLCSHYSSAAGTFNGHMIKILGVKMVDQGNDRLMREVLGVLEAGMEGVLEVTTSDGFADAFAAMWLESRFDEKTREQFRMNRGQSEEVPSFAEVSRFARLKAKTWAAYREEIRQESQEVNGGKIEVVKKTPEYASGTAVNISVPNRKRLNTDSGPAERKVNRTWARCYRCAGEHVVSRCDIFKKDDLSLKKKLIAEHKLCGSCVRPHQGKCTVTCSKCKGNHAEIMCEVAAA